MVYAGQSLYNPVTREHITFVQTTEDTNGQLLVFDLRVTPGGARLPAHIHSTQEERFEVLSGSLGVMLGGKKQVLAAGDQITLPAGVKHQWWNAGQDEVHFRVEVAPARNLERVLEAISGMAHAGKLNGKAMPKNPFRLAQIGKLSENYLPGIPIWMQKAMLALGSAFGRLLGYDPTFAEYCTVETAAIESVAA